MPEDVLRSADTLKKIYDELKQVGYLLAEAKTDDSVVIQDEDVELTIFCTSHDKKRVGIWLAADEFVMDEAQVAREIEQAVMELRV